MVSGSIERLGDNAADAVKIGIDGAEGYWIGSIISQADVRALQENVTRMFLKRIAEVAPQYLAEFTHRGLAGYHEIAHFIDHSAAWHRLARRFDQQALADLDRTDFMSGLRQTFGDFIITDEEDVGFPLVRWRLVRPLPARDVGPVHADSWYWDVNGWEGRQDRKLVKIWSLLDGPPGAAGLKVLPGSHHRKFEFGQEIRDGSLKPTFDAADLPMCQLPIEVGQSVIFHYNLLHGGVETVGDRSRISFELTIAVDPDWAADA